MRVIPNREMVQISPTWWRTQQTCHPDPHAYSATLSKFLGESIVNWKCYVWNLTWPVQGQMAQIDLFASCQLINLPPKCKIKPTVLIVFSSSLSPLFFFFNKSCFYLCSLTKVQWPSPLHTSELFDMQIINYVSLSHSLTYDIMEIYCHLIFSPLQY